MHDVLLKLRLGNICASTLLADRISSAFKVMQGLPSGDSAHLIGPRQLVLRRKAVTYRQLAGVDPFNQRTLNLVVQRNEAIFI